MCIINDPVSLKKERAKTGQIQLWKVIRGSNKTGIWGNTCSREKLRLGKNNIAKDYDAATSIDSFDKQPGQFHCCFTRKAARRYRSFRDCPSLDMKIIKVYADRKDIVQTGVDKYAGDFNGKLPAISVSKMEIKSLKHQR